MLRPLATAWLALACVAAAHGDVRVSGPFGDDMVLQRDAPVPVWGTADPGEEVTVHIGDARASATADAGGSWRATLPALKADATPRDLVVAGRTTVTFRNVLVGDVWICAGQSNMEINLRQCDVPDDVAAADLPLVRLLKLAHVSRAEPAVEVPGSWRPCTPETAIDFSAAGFYFGRRVQRETGLPIGLIQAAWGGTRIETWIPRVAWGLEPGLPDQAAEIARRHQAYRAELGKSLAAVEQWVAATRATLAKPDDGLPAVPGLPALPVSPIVNPGLHNYGYPTALANGMVHPLVPFAIKGVIWYQGESNYGDGDYDVKLRALAGGWRKLWQQGDFPFYYAQLPNFEKPNPNPAGGDGWAELRLAQFRARTIPNSGMAVTIDLGEAADIHPKNKRDVGERLARWALHEQYGRKDVVVSGPLYKGMQVEEGRIRIAFDHVAGGLMVGRKEGTGPVEEDAGGSLRRFAISGGNGAWHWADAVIDGDTVVVSSPQVPRPTAVRYAHSWNPEGCNLYNRNGLPASPFCTDH